MGRDRAAFDDFFASEYPALVRSLVLMTGDLASAEDAAQEAFARLYVHFSKVSGYERPGAWVRRVATNVMLSQRRRRRPAATPPVDLEMSSDRADVLRALGGLSRMQRAAVVLRYYEDRSPDEIGEILGCSASTARVHLHRARAKLAVALGEEVPDDAR